MRLSWSPTLKVVYNFRMGFPKNYCCVWLSTEISGSFAKWWACSPYGLFTLVFKWAPMNMMPGMPRVSIHLLSPSPTPNPSICLFELRWGWEFACLRSRSKPRAFAVWMKFTFYDNWSSRATHWLIFIVNKRTDTWIYILGDASTNASG